MKKLLVLTNLLKYAQVTRNLVMIVFYNSKKSILVGSNHKQMEIKFFSLQKSFNSFRQSEKDRT